MRHKIFFILFNILLLVFLFSGIKTVEASVQEEKARLIQQIQAIQKEIQRLKALISNFKLQKEINAESCLVVNLSDNSVILEKNIDRLYPIASITKLMSTVIAFENIDTSQTITLTEKMLEPLGYSPSLFLGLNVSTKNLLKASLIQSTNDAAESLTYFLEKEKFLNLMNQKAKELNMTNTFFYDAHGLNPSNRSTAPDIAKLLTYIYENHPEILSITKDNNFWLPDQTGRLLKFKNVNNFYQEPDFIGGKTGYLPEAKQTSALLFNVNEEPIAIVLLYSKNRQTDTLRILDWLKNNSVLK
ncbi:serine hydrolase [Patescibacteria group bacterium]|nr:serine hydrolase [Patescibacteria group bacterium]